MLYLPTQIHDACESMRCIISVNECNVHYDNCHHLYVYEFARSIMDDNWSWVNLIFNSRAESELWSSWVTNNRLLFFLKFLTYPVKVERVENQVKILFFHIMMIWVRHSEGSHACHGNYSIMQSTQQPIRRGMSFFCIIHTCLLWLPC